MRRQCADNKNFLPGRPAQAKALCLSGISVGHIAKRLKFLPPQVAEAKYLRPASRGVALAKTGQRLSSERSEPRMAGCKHARLIKKQRNE